MFASSGTLGAPDLSAFVRACRFDIKKSKNIEKYLQLCLTYKKITGIIIE